MKANKNDTENTVGLIRAWGAYIRMLVNAIVQRQTRISGMVK